VLYQFLLDDVARKQIKPEQLKKMQKGEGVDYIEDRQGNNNVKNKSHLIRTLSSKTPNAKADNIRMHNMARSVRHDEDGGPSSPIAHAYEPTTFGATIEREPKSATSTDSKRLTM